MSLLISFRKATWDIRHLWCYSKFLILFSLRTVIRWYFRVNGIVNVKRWQQVSQQKFNETTFFLAADFNENTGLVLVSASYFKPTWLHKFAVEKTQPRAFFLEDGREIQVPSMVGKQIVRHGEYSEVNATFVELQLMVKIIFFLRKRIKKNRKLRIFSKIRYQLQN